VKKLLRRVFEWIAGKLGYYDVCYPKMEYKVSTMHFVEVHGQAAFTEFGPPDEYREMIAFRNMEKEIMKYARVEHKRLEPWEHGVNHPGQTQITHITLFIGVTR
jgi:hypothetical protein